MPPKKKKGAKEKIIQPEDHSSLVEDNREEIVQ